MRHANIRIDILELVESFQQDDGSWSDENWVPALLEIPARISWTTGTETVRFGQKQHLRDAIIKTDIIDVSVLSRVKYGDDLFEVVDVENVAEMNRVMKISVKRITDQEPE